MSRIRSGNTRPEMVMRRALFALGYRFRIQVRTLPGTPDIVLPRYRTVIFINGCFWHGHEGCRLYTHPKTNSEFWSEKVRRNRERDTQVTERLESLNWNVVTVWECELKKSVLDATLDRVEAELGAGRARWESYLSRRRSDRGFARAESRRLKQLRAAVETELECRIPARILRLSRTESELLP